MSANLNKYQGIGRLTRDPEMRSVGGENAVCVFGFAVNNRRKNKSGDYEDDPFFIDIEAWNQGNRKLAQFVYDYSHKGDLVYVEGRLKTDRWETQDGEQKQKTKLVLDDIQLLTPRNSGETSVRNGSRPAEKANAPKPEKANAPKPAMSSGSEIPF